MEWYRKTQEQEHAGLVGVSRPPMGSRGARYDIQPIQKEFL